MSLVGGARSLDGGMRLRPLRLLRSVPLPIWLITALFGALLASWSVLVPQYHAPDEPNQVDAVMRLVQGAGWPHPGHAFVRPDGVGAIAASPYGSAAVPYELDFAPIDEAGATARDDRPTWDELGDTRQANGEVQPPGDIQQLVQHPPLYYLVGAAALWALPGDGDGLRWDVTIGTLRLLSALMVMWLPLLAWAGAHRLSGGNRIAATCAALLPLAVPQLSHIGSSVNNDNLLVLTAGLATVTIIYVLRGDTSPRTAALAGLFIGLALLSKSLGIVLVPMAVLAYLVAWRRARQDAAAGGRSVATGADRDAPFLLSDTGLLTVPADATRFPWRQLLLGGTVMVAAGGWWWIVNIVRYRTFQPETPGFPLGDDLDGDWASYLDVLVNGAARRWWGSFGWFETNLPMEVVGAASVVVIVLFALALVRGRDGRARVNLLFLLWPTLGLFGLMTLQATMAFTDHGHVSGISGRYLYGGMTALAIGVGLGASTFGRNVARVFPVLFLVAAAAIQWWSVRSVLRHFWKPVGGNLSDAWEAMTAWSPWPPSAMVATMWTGAGLAVAVLVACVWIAVLGDGQDRPGPTTFRDPSGWPPGPDIWVPGRLTVEDPAEQHISRPAREAHPETAPETVLETAPKVHRGATEPAPAERSGTDSVPSGSTAPESAPSRSAPDEHGSSSPFRSGPPGANSAPSTAKGRPPSTTSPVPSH